MAKKRDAKPLDRCPICGAALVLPYGPEGADGIVVSSQPGEWELSYGRPFVPQAPAGRVLHREFARAGLSVDDFRLTNVWLHTPGDHCLDWHVERCAVEMRPRRAVLLLGSVPVKCYLGGNVMTLSGTLLRRRVAHHALESARFVVCGPNPADALHEPVGEVRLAVSRFAEAYKRLKGG